MTWGYEQFKKVARAGKRSVASLLALDPSNDPFYVGRPSQRKMAKWFAALWEQFGYSTGVHLRRVHYQLVSQKDGFKRADDSPYQNTDQCWNYLCAASKYARSLHLIDPTSLEDHRNPPPRLWGTERPTPEPTHQLYGREFASPEIDLSAPDLDFPMPRLTRLEDGAHDSYHLEVWVEKSTMNDVLMPICKDLRANLVTSLGFQSITSCVGLLARIAQRNRPARIFYISDFDPAGDRMPTSVARQLEFWRGELGLLSLDIKLHHLCLTKDQVDAWNLPRIPIKESDQRRANFERRREGAGAVELDALEAIHPGELGTIVREALLLYRDAEHEDELQRTLAANNDRLAEQWLATAREELIAFRDTRDSVERIVDRYTKRVEWLRSRLARDMAPYDEELARIWGRTMELFERFAPEISQLPEHPDPGPNLSWEWLLDTDRDYLTQIAAYQRHREIKAS